MEQPSATAVCSGCGATSPRSEMFGVEPNLLCEPCADRVRARYERIHGAAPRLRPPVVTSLVVAAATLLFVVEHLWPAPPAWLAWLHVGPRVWDGEVWRLVTAAFLHAAPLFGVLHILFNAWWTWDLGRGIEATWGPWALLALVLGGAAVASGLEWMVNGPGVGLSGVVYALAGFLFALRRVNAVAAALMNPRTVNVLATWFVVCVVLTVADKWNVANWAHGGGAAWGLLAGAATASRRRRWFVPLVGLLTLAFVAAVPFVAFGDQADLRRLWILVRP